MTEEKKLDLILDEIQGMKSDMQGMKSKVQSMETDMQDMKTGIRKVERGLQEVRDETIKTNLLIENEIRVNIMRVAEGHLDLSRKVDEAIRLSYGVKAKQEIQDIYIKMHNSKLEALCS